MGPYSVGSPRRASQSAAAAATSSTSATRDVQAQPASAGLKEGIMSCLQGAASLFAACCPCLSPPSQDPMERMPLLNASPPNAAIRNEQPVAMAVVVAQPPPLNDRCQLATDGWQHADADFSWHNVDAAAIQSAKTDIVQNGMLPMLQELLGDDGMQNPGLQQRLATCVATTPRVYSAEEFGLRIYYASNDLSGTGDDNDAISGSLQDVRTAVQTHFIGEDVKGAKLLNTIATNTTPENLIRILFKIASKTTGSQSQELNDLIQSKFREAGIDLQQPTPLSAAICTSIAARLEPEWMTTIQTAAQDALTHALSETMDEMFSSVQGKAFGNTVVLNQGSAEASVGMHLLTHELMHTLADPSTVDTLRQTAHMGDEGPNEFFARLASMNAGLDRSTSTEKTPYKLNPAWSDADLTKTLARAYFLGDAAALASVRAGIPEQ